jgi:hypothetical protein
MLKESRLNDIAQAGGIAFPQLGEIMKGLLRQ